jgi:hypothetical protein
MGESQVFHFASSSQRLHPGVTFALYHWRMRHVIVIFLLLFSTLAGNVAAQAPHSNRCPSAEEIYERLLWSGLVQNETEVQTQIAKRREAQHKEQQFLLKAEKVIESWRALAREYREKGAFNIKTAKQVSKAFHDLEKSEGWPK